MSELITLRIVAGCIRTLVIVLVLPENQRQYSSEDCGKEKTCYESHYRNYVLTANGQCHSFGTLLPGIK